MRGVLGRRLAGTIIVVAAAMLVTLRSEAAPNCVTTPLGIECSASGGSTDASHWSSGGGDGSLPPVRYLVTDVDAEVGPCWYWSRYGPGLDAWDPANDHAIIMTRTFTPQCPDDPPAPQVTGTVLTAMAWEVFRSFPLQPPAPVLVPWPTGYTGLPSHMTVGRAPRFRHDERLPDGSRLAVRASVRAVVVRWGDGSPALRHDPAAASTSGIHHTYAVKTCTRHYRQTHPAGSLCHPSLVRYPVDVTWVWEGSYVLAGRWIDLGEIRRTARLRYDVDEIIGVVQR